TQPTSLLARTYEGVFEPNTFIQVHDSRKKYAIGGNGGRSRDRIPGTFINSRSYRATFNAPTGCGICGDDTRDSTAWSAKASHYRNTSRGNHTLVAGAEEVHEQRLTNGTRWASEIKNHTGLV